MSNAVGNDETRQGARDTYNNFSVKEKIYCHQYKFIFGFRHKYTRQKQIFLSSLYFSSGSIKRQLSMLFFPDLVLIVAFFVSQFTQKALCVCAQNQYVLLNCYGNV